MGIRIVYVVELAREYAHVASIFAQDRDQFPLVQVKTVRRWWIDRN